MESWTMQMSLLTHVKLSGASLKHKRRCTPHASYATETSNHSCRPDTISRSRTVQGVPLGDFSKPT